jgi:hypothetical protein
MIIRIGVLFQSLPVHAERSGGGDMLKKAAQDFRLTRQTSESGI